MVYKIVQKIWLKIYTLLKLTSMERNYKTYIIFH